MIAVTRRSIVTLAMASLTALSPSMASYGQQQAVTVRLRVDQAIIQMLPPQTQSGLSIQQDTSTEAKALSSQAPPEKAVPVILIAIGVLAIPVLWNSIEEMARQYYYGGVLIDARSSPPNVTYSKAVPSNMVFFIGADGKYQEFKSMDFSEADLVKLLPKGR